MTALGWRRQHNLRMAGAIGAVAALFMGLAIAVGVSALANSDAGRDVTGGAVPDRVRLPLTYTAAVALLDERSELISVAVMVLRPEGEGGSLVVLPVDAILDIETTIDVPDLESVGGEVSGAQGVVTPAEAWRNGDLDALAARVEALTSISLDLMEVVHGAEIKRDLTEVLAVDTPLRWMPPEGINTATLVALVDSDIIGPSVLPGVARDISATAALALVAWNPPDPTERAGVQVSVWRALIEAGQPSGETGASAPRDLQEFLGALRSGPIGVRGLRTAARSTSQEDLDPGRAREVLDRAEVLLVFGQIAPARLGAPNPSSRFRVVASFDASQLAALPSDAVGRTNAALAHRVITDLIFLDGNVISVLASDPAREEVRAPAITRVEVADVALRATLAEQWSRVFGEFEVVVADIPIDGVDATIVLGVSFLQGEE